MADILREPVLIIDQRAKFKLMETKMEYDIKDQHDRPIGFVRQENLTLAKRALKAVVNLDTMETVVLKVYDEHNNPVLGLKRPRTTGKSTFEITDGRGAIIGNIRQERQMGKVSFAMEDPSGRRLGTIRSTNWRNTEFMMTDAAGAQIGEVTKTHSGLARAALTHADNYVVRVNPGVSGPLRMLTLVAGLTVDTALHQGTPFGI